MKKNVFLLLAFFGASTLLAQNTFPTTGNVGIGISTPAYALDINGTIRSNGGIFRSGSGKFVFYDGTGGSWAPINSKGLNIGDWNTNPGYGNIVTGDYDFRLNVKDEDRFFIESSNGNVGIGTITPSNKFTVNGFIKAEGSDGRLMLENPSVTTAVYLRNRGDSGQRKFEVLYGTSIKMLMNNNGDLGIGTTNPTAKLEVNGTGDQWVYVNQGTIGGLRIGSSNGGKLNVLYRDKSNDIVTLRAGHDLGELSFIAGGSASERMRIDKNGNVGIGTTNPSTILDIESGTNDGLDFPILRLSSKDVNVINGQTLGELQFYNKDADGAHISSFVKAIATEGYGRKGELSFGTTGVNSANATERMRIDENGNIGIGITNPDEKLHVAGNMKLSSGNFDVNGGKATFWSSIGGSWAPVQSRGLNIGDWDTDSAYGNIVTGDYDFRLNVKDADRFFIESTNGNVGIGTINPSAKLDIESGNDGLDFPVLRLSSKDLNAVSGQTLGELQFYNKDADGAHISSFVKAIATEGYGRKGELSFGTTGVNSTNATERMRIDENGNVGIGTTNPSSNLDVVGSIKSSANIIANAYYTGGEESLKKNSGFLYLGTGNFTSGIFTNKTIRTTENVEPYSDLVSDLGKSTTRWNTIYGKDIDVNGSVNIAATTVPTGYNLAVGGKIITEEVKVKLQSSWPDYVFKKEYDLLSVEEVEAYIKKNGHLPKMPSAKEVEKEGILLGDMNKKLLEKIEELTLYTIDQKKEVKKQERRIKTQEEKMKKLEEENKQLKELLERVAKIEKQLKAE